MSHNFDVFAASQDLAGRERSVKHFDDLGDSVPYSPQARNDAHIRPIITKLPKRYECGELHPHIHFAIGNGRFDPVACCGVFMNARHHQEVYLGSLLGPGLNDNQLPMLIKAIHVMEDEQGMVRTLPLGDSVVWLQRLNDCAGLVTDSLYFSTEHGKFLGSRRPRAEDWKFGIGVYRGTSSLAQELPDEIVKRSAVAVQDFADEDWKAGRDDLLTPEILELLDTLRIVFHDFAVSFFIQKPVNFDIKILDVLIGPFESFVDPF
jgi:hypothetical protein